MMPADAIAASFWLAILPTSTRWPTAAAVASTSSATSARDDAGGDLPVALLVVTDHGPAAGNCADRRAHEGADRQAGDEPGHAVEPDGQQQDRAERGGGIRAGDRDQDVDQTSADQPGEHRGGDGAVEVSHPHVNQGSYHGRTVKTTSYLRVPTSAMRPPKAGVAGWASVPNPEGDEAPKAGGRVDRPCRNPGKGRARAGPPPLRAMRKPRRC